MKKKTTIEPSKLLEEKDIKIEEESSDLELDNAKKSIRMEDNAYFNEKNPSENQRTYRKRPNLSKRPRKTVTNMNNIQTHQSPPKIKLTNETMITENPKNNENSDVAELLENTF
jgi:hypothetical protein